MIYDMIRYDTTFWYSVLSGSVDVLAQFSAGSFLPTAKHVLLRVKYISMFDASQ